jgi:integrase
LAWALVTILDGDGQSARQIADRLGHSRASMTQDGYLGRKVRNPEAAKAIDAVFGQAARGDGADGQKGGKSVG